MADEIQNGFYPISPPVGLEKHTHVGSIENLSNAKIQATVQKTYFEFPFSQIHKAITQLFLPLK